MRELVVRHRSRKHSVCYSWLKCGWQKEDGTSKCSDDPVATWYGLEITEPVALWVSTVGRRGSELSPVKTSPYSPTALHWECPCRIDCELFQKDLLRSVSVSIYPVCALPDNNSLYWTVGCVNSFITPIHNGDINTVFILATVIFYDCLFLFNVTYVHLSSVDLKLQLGRYFHI